MRTASHYTSHILTSDVHSLRCPPNISLSLRGLKVSDLLEPDLPREFRADEDEELSCRLALSLNAAQAALQCERYSEAEQHATKALELEVSNRSLGFS